ncbi:MAG: hypothetical protein IJI36_08555 [Kiritimatiellae bacterium]|nr:hypothetical protein [Kiritimatiellia bacterium]
MIEVGDIDGIKELWPYISSDSSLTLLNDILSVKVPDGLDVSDAAAAEIKAAYILSSRMATLHDGAAFVGGCVVASTLSTREVHLTSELEEDICRSLEVLINRYLEDGTWGRTETAAEEINSGLSALNEGISSCASFAGLMKQIPPMVRIAIADLICHSLRDAQDSSLWNRRIHYSLGYGERAYGCSEEVGRSYGEALEIFQVADMGKTLPSSLTKAMLAEGLASYGVTVKKSAKRHELVELARTIPGLVQELFAKCEPDVVVVRPEYADEAVCWSRRYHALTYVGQAVLTCMGATHLRGDNLSVMTLDDDLRTRSQMVANAARINAQDESSVYTVPAWELMRFGQRRVPRDWAARWKAAGDAVGWVGASRDFGTLIALKDSPIWAALGNGAGGYKDTLGNPYPPFAFSSGMAWAGVDRRECIRLGLIGPHDRPGVPQKVGAVMDKKRNGRNKDRN